MDKIVKTDILDKTINRIKNLTLKVVQSLSTEGLQFGNMDYCGKIITEIQYTKDIIDDLVGLKEHL